MVGRGGLSVKFRTGRIGRALVWERRGRGRILVRVIFEGARSRPGGDWCIALGGELGVKLGPDARGVVM